METKRCCVYNATRGCYLGFKVTVADSVLQPLDVLKFLIRDLALDAESGLWLIHLLNAPRMMRLFPVDLVYLDKNQRVLQGVELLTNVEFPQFNGLVSSALILPLNTLSSTETCKDDHLVICAEEELESCLAQVPKPDVVVPGMPSPDRPSITSVGADPISMVPVSAQVKTDNSPVKLSPPSQVEVAPLAFRSLAPKIAPTEQVSPIQSESLPAPVTVQSAHPAVAPAPMEPSPVLPVEDTSAPVLAGQEVVPVQPPNQQLFASAPASAVFAGQRAGFTVALNTNWRIANSTVPAAAPDSDREDAPREGPSGTPTLASSEEQIDSPTQEIPVINTPSSPTTEGERNHSQEELYRSAKVSASDEFPATAESILPSPRRLPFSTRSKAPLSPKKPVERGKETRPPAKALAPIAGAAPSIRNDASDVDEVVGKGLPTSSSFKDTFASDRGANLPQQTEPRVRSGSEATVETETKPISSKASPPKPSSRPLNSVGSAPGVVPSTPNRTPVSEGVLEKLFPGHIVPAPAEIEPKSPNLSPLIKDTGSLKSRMSRWLNGKAIERRKATRISLPGLIAYGRVGSDAREYEVGDVSPSGLYLRTPERWPTGEILLLTLQKKGSKDHTPDRQVAVEAGTVRWGEDGIGLTFVLPKEMEFHPWRGLEKTKLPETGAEYFVREFRKAKALGFVRRICAPAVVEVEELLDDRLSIKRIATAVGIALKAEAMFSQMEGVVGFRAHPELVVKIIENGSWADSDWVQQLWAGLLVTSCTADGQDKSNLIFVELLDKLTPIHLRILSAACKKGAEVISEGESISKLTLYFSPEELIEATGSQSLLKIQQTISHLSTFGLLAESARSSYIPITEKTKTTPTNLGLQMHARCHGRR
jgi:hypothetical protein